MRVHGRESNGGVAELSLDFLSCSSLNLARPARSQALLFYRYPRQPSPIAAHLCFPEHTACLSLNAELSRPCLSKYKLFI